jgi:hypothetical protein
MYCSTHVARSCSMCVGLDLWVQEGRWGDDKSRDAEALGWRHRWHRLRRSGTVPTRGDGQSRFSGTATVGYGAGEENSGRWWPVEASRDTGAVTAGWWCGPGGGGGGRGGSRGSASVDPAAMVAARCWVADTRENLAACRRQVQNLRVRVQVGRWVPFIYATQ